MLFSIGFFHSAIVWQCQALKQLFRHSLEDCIFKGEFVESSLERRIDKEASVNEEMDSFLFDGLLSWCVSVDGRLEGKYAL